MALQRPACDLAKAAAKLPRSAADAMQRLKFVLRCLFSAALIAFIARKVNWGDLASILSTIDWRWALAGSSLTAAVIAGLALRWKIFLRQQRIELPFQTVLSLTWAGQFFNSVLPGSTGGDVFKIYQLCRQVPDRKAAAAATVFVDRFSALIALLALAGIAFFLEPVPLRAFGLPRVGQRNFMLGIGLLAAGVAATWLLLRRPMFSLVIGRVRRTLSAVAESFTLSGEVVLALALAFAIHLLNFLAIYLFGRALDIGITYPQVLLMMPIVLLLVMLPVTVNGHGLRELLLIAYFSQLAVRIHGRTDVGYQDAAVALSVLMVANDLLWSLPGGVKYLTRSRSVAEVELTAPLV